MKKIRIAVSLMLLASTAGANILNRTELRLAHDKFMTARDIYARSFSNITLQNKSGASATVYALYVPQLGYTTTTCNVATILYTSTNAGGTFSTPVAMTANQKIQIGQNFLYNMLYTAIYYNNQISAPSPCTLPGCTWLTDASVVHWCIFLGALSPASSNTSTTSSLPPYANAVSGTGYNYDLVTHYSYVGPITCNDENLTCSVSSAQNVAFPQ